MRSPETRSFYDLLDISSDAQSSEIRAAFLRLAQLYHPDLNANDPGADRRFKQIRRIYEVLSDPIKRASYDEDPSRFWLSDADILCHDRRPIVTRPMYPPRTSWGGRMRQRSANLFRPQWLSDTRLRQERHVVLICAVTAIVVMSFIPMIVRSHGQAAQQESRRFDESGAGQRTNPSRDRSDRTPLSYRSPLQDVINSVTDLRETTTTTVTTAEKASDSASEDVDSPRPRFELMDELDVPFPGWPILPSPSVPPPVAPQATPVKSEVNINETVVHSHVVGRNETDWAASAVDPNVSSSLALPATSLPPAYAHPWPQPTNGAAAVHSVPGTNTWITGARRDVRQPADHWAHGAAASLLPQQTSPHVPAAVDSQLGGRDLGMPHADRSMAFEPTRLPSVVTLPSYPAPQPTWQQRSSVPIPQELAATPDLRGWSFPREGQPMKMRTSTPGAMSDLGQLPKLPLRGPTGVPRGPSLPRHFPY